MKRSEFVLQYEDGTYHGVRKGHAGSMGFDTLERSVSIGMAEKFASYEYAVTKKNNTSHLRYLPMKVVELQYDITIVDRGDVPIQVPDWDDFDPEFDAHQFVQVQAAHD